MNMVRRNSEIKPFYSNFLDDFLNTGLSAFEDRRGVSALNVKEDEKELALELRVPGMKKEDIHLDYRDGILTISGEKNEEKEEKDKDKYLSLLLILSIGVSNYLKRDMMLQRHRLLIKTVSWK